MSTPSITVCMDKDTKIATARIAEGFGFALSSVTRAFNKQMVRVNRIPFTLSYPDPNDESIAAIKEADNVIAKQPRYIIARA